MYEHSTGFSFGKSVGESITAGGEVTVSTGAFGVDVSATVSYEESRTVEVTEERSVSDTYGGETVEEEKWSATSVIRVPPGKVYRAEGMVKQA